MGVPKRSTSFTGGGGGVSQAVLDAVRSEAEGYTDDAITALPIVVARLGLAQDSTTDPDELRIERQATARIGGGSHVSNTTTETPLFEIPSTTVPLADPDPAPLQLVRVTAGGRYLNNSGSAKDVTFRFKIGAGGVTVAFPALAASASERYWNVAVDFVLSDFFGNLYCYLMGTAHMSAPGGGAGTSFPVAGGYGVGAGPYALAATVQHSAAAATIQVPVAVMTVERSGLGL